MAGVIEYTLGLEANNFLRTLGLASGRVLSFAAIGQTIQSAVGQMWNAIERGGNLNDMAAAASLSVAELYKLRRGFEDVGAAAENVPLVVNKFRRILASGDADDVLAQMGLDPKALSKLDAATQLDSVAQALSRLNGQSRSAAAFNLFGREGATVMLQIANSGKDFSDAMGRASADANVWGKVATTFDTISDKVKEIEAHIQTMWATLAGAMIQSFKEGRLADTLFDIFNTVFDAVGAALPDLFIGGLVKIGEILLRVLNTPLIYLQSALDAIIQGWFGIIAQIPGVRDALGIPENFMPEDWDTIVKRNKENGLDFFGANFGDMSTYAQEHIGNGASNAAEIMAKLWERLNNEVGKLPSEISPTKKGEVVDLSKPDRKKVSVTEIEKMGGILAGIGRGFGGSDFARSTADNTRRSAEILGRIEGKIQSNGEEVND